MIAELDFSLIRTDRTGIRKVLGDLEAEVMELIWEDPTQRPLALASTLAKVWHHAVAGTPVNPVQPLVEESTPIEARITRLLGAIGLVDRASRSQLLALGVGAALAGLLALQAANVIVLLESMGCGPAASLWRMIW